MTLDFEGLCQQMFIEMQEFGVKIYENCAIKNVLLGEKNEVYAVDTDAGIVETNHFVNAAGIVSFDIYLELNRFCFIFFFPLID